MWHVRRRVQFCPVWEKLHATTDMPVGLSDVLKLAPNERALLGANEGEKVSTTQLKALVLV